MLLVLRTTAAVEEEQAGASLLFSLLPHPETSHANSVTMFVLLHRNVMGAWGGGTSACAAQTPSRTSSANLSVLLPAQILKSWRYAHNFPLLLCLMLFERSVQDFL